MTDPVPRWSAMAPEESATDRPEITLVHDVDCPNVPEARAALREALERTGVPPRWIERDRAAPSGRYRVHGSPTILIDGVDVVGEVAETRAASCRIYSTGAGLRGVPPVELIVSAIERRRRESAGAKETT